MKPTLFNIFYIHFIVVFCFYRLCEKAKLHVDNAVVLALQKSLINSLFGKYITF